MGLQRDPPRTVRAPNLRLGSISAPGPQAEYVECHYSRWQGFKCNPKDGVTFYLGKENKSQRIIPLIDVEHTRAQKTVGRTLSNLESADGKVSFRSTEKFPGSLHTYNGHETTCPVLCRWLSLEMA